MPTAGTFYAVCGGFFLHRLPGQILLIVSAIGGLVSVLLFALIPATDPNYWAWVFPAMIGCTTSVDILYNVSNVFITTNVPIHRQGVAGALINALIFLGISFFLGLADLAVTVHERNGGDNPYRVAFWFATGCAVVPLVLFCCIRIGKAKSELRMEERDVGESSETDGK
jgi:MFS family permease